MNLRDLLGETLRTLRAHTLRTALTMFGIAWGIVSITLMVAAGEGLRARGWGVVASLAQVLSPIKNFEPFGKGVLDTYALACSVLLIVVFLMLAIRQLDAQRLRG